MALNIQKPGGRQAGARARATAPAELTEAVIVALRAELDREHQRMGAPGMAKQLLEIGARYAALPSYDERSDDEILGYDEHGVPG